MPFKFYTHRKLIKKIHELFYKGRNVFKYRTYNYALIILEVHIKITDFIIPTIYQKTKETAQ